MMKCINKKQKLCFVGGTMALVLIVILAYFSSSKQTNDLGVEEDEVIIKDNIEERNYRYFGFALGGYYYGSTGKLIDIFFEEEIISTYICTASDSCTVFDGESSYYFNVNDKIVLIRDEQYLFYNFETGEIISERYLEVYNMDGYENDSIDDRFIAINQDEEAIIIDYEGKVYLSGGYEDLGEEISYSPRYGFSFTEDYIYAKKNGNWGIVKISDGSILVDFLYEAVFYGFYGDTYVACEHFSYLEERYYLIDVRTGYDYFSGGRSFIGKYDQFYFVVNDDNKLEIYDLGFNQILNQDIDVPIEHTRRACCTIPRGIYISSYNADPGTVRIYIDHPDPDIDYDYNTKIYVFDLNAWELKKYSE